MSRRLPGQLALRFPGALPTSIPLPDTRLVTLSQAVLITGKTRDHILRKLLRSGQSLRRIGGEIVVDLDEIEDAIHD